MPERRFEAGRLDGIAQCSSPVVTIFDPDLVANIVERHCIPARQRMLRPRHHMIDMVEQRPGFEPVGLVFGRFDHKKIERTVQPEPDHLFGRATLQRQFKSRQVNSDLTKQDVQVVILDRVRDSEGQRRYLCLADLAREVLSGLRGFVSSFEKRQYLAAKVGQMGPRALAAEERAAKFLFELLDRAGERWLRDTAFFGRPREIQAPRHGKKVSNLMHLHLRFMPQVGPHCICRRACNAPLPRHRRGSPFCGMRFKYSRRVSNP
jgi:hypothetical protein